jgi:hypothetical protein
MHFTERSIYLKYLNKAVGYEVLVFQAHFGVPDKTHNSRIVNKDVTAMGSACYGLPNSLLHYFCGQVLSPTLHTKSVSTLEASHQVILKYFEADFAFFSSRS